MCLVLYGKTSNIFTEIYQAALANAQGGQSFYLKISKKKETHNEGFVWIVRKKIKKGEQTENLVLTIRYQENKAERSLGFNPKVWRK